VRKAITVFTLLVRLIPRHRAEQIARRTPTESRVRKVDWFARLGALVFGQLADCSSLRSVLHHVGELSFVREALGLKRLAKSTLTDALEKPVREIFTAAFEDVLGRLLDVCAAQGRRSGRKWREMLTILDASYVALCLSEFDWARRPGSSERAGVKLHVAYSEYMRAPEQLLVTEGHVHERNAKAAFSIEEGRTYVFDRGYFDRAFFDQIRNAGAHFVTRLKRGVNFLRYSSRAPTDRRVLEDVDVTIGTEPAAGLLRLVRYRDPQTRRVYEFLTDRHDLGALSVADAYKARWQIELFFRFLKQHLRIKRFYGTSREAVEAQLYAALIAFVLVEIARRLGQRHVGSSLVMWRSVRVSLTTPSVDAVWFRQLLDSRDLHLLLSERFWP
jgi:hypothetical protein